MADWPLDTVYPVVFFDALRVGLKGFPYAIGTVFPRIAVQNTP